MNTQLIIATIIAVIFAFGFPITASVFWNKKYPGNVWPIFAGVICFTLFAMILEQILHYIFLIMDGPISNAITSSAVLYMLYGAFAAGIFEETGRLFGFKVLLKKCNNKEASVAYGIGHGCVEVIFVMGMTYVTYLLAAFGMDFWSAEANDMIRNVINQINLGVVGVEIYERLCAISIHIGLSMIMFVASRNKSKMWLYPVSICIHALVDAPSALYQFGTITSLAALEGWCTFLAVICIGLGYYLLFKKENIVEADEELKNMEELIIKNAEDNE